MLRYCTIYWFLAIFGDDERLGALRQKGFNILPVVVELVTKIQIQPEDFSCDVEIL
ncbi:hypothetical protein H6G97_46850 [Nostoc flagelliforme FACHB-838]|jgi:hypothetical protein|uniref:Biopterin-dependent aromatic amino acid hydroxylase family profile domain-containing protein n=1 Tax=Nostoc flagelliforme FACHB-838 TaxID=2692904 RepID=A0ABR8E3U4_9NOSO|nr:hypothetical protein [Nostoc flagelliforme]MBD2536407.1 hypothetical protein [Nostoc flagelliforme FACHB-838]